MSYEIAIPVGIIIIIIGVYLNERNEFHKRVRLKEQSQLEQPQLEQPQLEQPRPKVTQKRKKPKQPKTVKIGDCVLDLGSNTCMTHNCKVSSSEPCPEYSMPYLLSGSLTYYHTEWHDKYQKALRQRELGKKEYRKQYTILYLGGKVGIAALVCWGIMIILGLVTWISVLVPSIPDLQFPALLATFGLAAGILTVIAVFRG